MCLKKIISSSGFLVLLTSSLQAQVKLGIKGGANINSVHHTNFNYPTTEYSANVGYYIGGYASFPLSKKSVLIAELQYSVRGGKTEGENHHFNYLELPFLYSYSVLNKVALEGGPSINFKISDNVDFNVEKIDFGLNLGLRVPVNKKLALTSRYYYGLKSIYDITFIDGPLPTDNSDEIKYYNRTIQFGFTYKLQ